MPSDAGSREHLGLVREVLRGPGSSESSGRAQGLSPRWAGLCSGRLDSDGGTRCREDKEFGFRGSEGRLLLLQDCDVRVQVAEGGAVSGKAGLGGLLGLTLRRYS